MIIASLRQDGFDVGIIEKLIFSLTRAFGHSIKSGMLILDSKDGTIKRIDFIRSLLKGRIASREVTLKPGESLYFFIKDLALKLNLDEAKLASNYKARFKDGMIIANTYRLPLGFDEKYIMDYLLSRSSDFFSAFAKKFSLNDKKLDELIIIASILEKEAASADEMPLIASVIYNRLKRGMHLQLDGSLNYGEFSHQAVTKARILSDMTSYNTYKFYGLPKNPIGAVSELSLRAALFPERSDFLYFVLKNGKHIFAKTYQEHLKNIRR